MQLIELSFGGLLLAMQCRADKQEAAPQVAWSACCRLAVFMAEAARSARRASDMRRKDK